MYTLEDDHETSSRLNKRDVLAGSDQLPPVPDEAGASQAGADQTTRPDTTAPAPKPETELIDIAQQVTFPFKRLATPDQGGSQKVALAALTMACIGVFFTALDQTVVVTALPQIITDLQVPITRLDHASWIISAYLLGFVIAMPLMGRVSDIYGRRRIFVLCLAIFGLGSIFCAVAPQLGQAIDLGFLAAFHIDTSSPGLIWLIIARLIQAIGGGAVVPVAMAIAGDFYTKEKRGLALGIIGAVTEAGGVLGPLYGAIVVEKLGWQYIFYLNVPLVIALIVVAWMLIPKGKRLNERIDWLGATLLALALTCLSLGLAQQGTSLGPVNPNAPTAQNNPIALILAILFFVGFIFVERRARWPVVDLSLFKKLAFSATSLVSLLVGAALIIAMADIPIFIDTVLQQGVMDSGLALLRLTALIPVGALLGGWLCSRITCRYTAILGLLFTAAGFFLMSRWPANVDWNQITISAVTAGLGFGLVIAPIGTTAINAVRARQVGMSSAIVTALRMVGMTLGLAALTSWALAYFKELVSTYPTLTTTATADQFASWSKGYAAHLVQSAHTVYSSVFFTSMILCLLAIVPAVFLWGNKAPVAELEPDEPEPTINDELTVSIASAGAVGAARTWPAWLPPERRRILAIVSSIGLVLLLIGGGVFAALNLEIDFGDDNSSSPTAATNNGADPTTAAISGPRMIQLGLDKIALTSVFVSQLNLGQGALSDLNVTPMPNDGLLLTLNLNIDANGIHRTMPIELDGILSVDKQQNLQLQVQHIKRDGTDAGPAAAANMQKAINQLLTNAVMPSLRGQLKGVELISVHTNNTLPCSKGTTMLVLLVKAPPIQGIAPEQLPKAFCLTGPLDLKKLLPQK